MSFGFDPETVFGNNGKKRKDGIGSSVFGRANGIPTFRTEDPMIDVFGLGEDFGERVVRRAGRANGKEGGFLGTIGMQQFGLPTIIGREPTVAGARRAKKARKGAPRRRKVASGFFGLEETLFGAERRVGQVSRKDIETGVKVIRKKVTKFKAKREAKETRKRAGLNNGGVRFRGNARLTNNNAERKS